MIFKYKERQWYGETIKKMIIIPEGAEDSVTLKRLESMIKFSGEHSFNEYGIDRMVVRKVEKNICKQCGREL